MSALSSEQLHATAIAVKGRAVLLSGPSGAGKSDLALRLIDRGAQLISDDVTLVRRVDGSLRAFPPERIKGKLEVRALGIFDMDYIDDAPAALLIDLVDQPPRFPQPAQNRIIAGVSLPVVQLHAFEASAPIKVEIALKRISG